LFTDNVAWNKESTHTNDRASFLPIETAAELASEGLFGGLAARFHGVPTEYSQRKTLTEDAPEILSRVREDRADAAVLCPLCPVCHQTVSLVARHLETNGIPTVIVGSALDVVEHCGVPRFYFTDFPLGNPCGHPWQPEMQREIIRQALSLFETVKTPRTTVMAPFSWKEDGVVWRARYGRVDPTEKERLLKLGKERRRQQAMAKQILAERAAPKHKIACKIAGTARQRISDETLEKTKWPLYTLRQGRRVGQRAALSMITLSRTMRTTSLPPSRRSARQLNGRRRTAIQPTSLASGT
jgi:D-proline reductase (dithiol) PrdB